MSDYPEYIIDGEHVVYLRSDIAQSSYALSTRINAISRDCYPFVGMCGPYPGECKSYLVLYYSSLEDIDHEILLLHEYVVERIQAYLVAVIFDDMSEIYDVCVEKTSRKKGIAKELIASLIRQSTKPQMWLGVDIRSPHYVAAISAYISNGFINPSIRNITPHGATTNSLFTGLTYTAGTTITKQEAKDTIQLAKRWRDQALKELDAQTTTFLISENLIKRFYDVYIPDQVEYAGIFRIMGYDPELRGILGFPVESEVKGNSDNFTVDFPKETNMYAFFHTHPNVCYTDHKCFIGWPSGADMSNSFRMYAENGLLIQFIFSKEGVYAVQLTPQMQVLSQRLSKECIGRISSNIFTRFTHSKEFGEANRSRVKYEGIHEVTVDADEQHARTVRYFSTVNSYTIGRMLAELNVIDAYELKQCLNDTNIIGDPLVFNVTFISYQDVINREQIEVKVFVVENEKLAKVYPLPVDIVRNNGRFIV